MGRLARVVPSLFSKNSNGGLCKKCSLAAGGFTSGGERDVIDVHVGTGLMKLGQDTRADLAGLVDRPFGEEDDNLAELLIGALCNQIRYAKMGTEPALEFLGLNLETTGADGVVATA